MGSLRKTFLSMVLLNTMLFFALIAIHETSHVLVGWCFGCEGMKAVIFDSSLSGPHTEMICASKINEFFVYIGSLLITSLFSLGFLFAEIKERNISFISLGISIILGSLDIGFILNSGSVVYPMMTIGLSLVTAGEYLVGSHYLKEDASLDVFKNGGFLEE